MLHVELLIQSLFSSYINKRNKSISISFWQPFVSDVSDSDHFYSKRDRKKIQNQNYNFELHVGGRIHILHLTKST